MDGFWAGFEKRAGAVTVALKRVGMNTPSVRRGMAQQIKKNRRALSGSKSQLEAGAVDGDRGLVVDHGAHGGPSGVIEKTPGSRAKQLKLKAA